MANEHTKDFNAMLHKETDMPKIQIVTDEQIVKRYGGERMFFAPPIWYSDIMKTVPHGKLITVGSIRAFLAKRNNADFTCPMTAGIFVSIAAWASEQRDSDNIPYWRTLKTDGEINQKYPGGIERQKELLEGEGHTIITRGKKNMRSFVLDYEQSLYNLAE